MPKDLFKENNISVIDNSSIGKPKDLFELHNVNISDLDISPKRQKPRDLFVGAGLKLDEKINTPRIAIDTGEEPTTIDRYIVNPIKAAKASIKQGAGGILQSIGESMADTRSPSQQIADTYGLKLPKDMPALRKSVTPEFITNIGKKVATKGKDIVSQTQGILELLSPKEDAPYVEKLAFKVLHNLGLNAPGLAASIITKRPMAGLGFLGGVSYGEKYATERKRGASIDEAHTRALGEAGSEIGTEYIPISILIKPGLSIGKRIAQTLLSELVGENVNTAYSLMQDKANYEPDKPFGDFVVQDLMPAFAETSAVAGISSLIMGAGAHPFVRKIEKAGLETKPKATGLNLEQPTKAEVPKFESEPVIKVKGEGLKIEPVIEKPIEKKSIVSHEENIIVKGEKPVTLPIVEELPTEETITPERENPSLDRSPKINAIRIDKSKDTKSYAEIKNINPNELVTIYRAVPKNAKEEITPGDFVAVDKEVANFYANDLLRRKKTNEAKYIIIKVPANSLKLHPNHQEQGVENEFIYNPQKEVIASEETKGQEAQESLPLKQVSFASVQDARSWIKTKSKEYGGRNQFLASKEYETAYPEVKRVFDEQKQKETEGIAKAREVRINKESDGSFSLNYVQRPESYVASSGGLYGGKATYKTEAEAIEKANKLNLTIVPEQGTSPETKGLPEKVAPVVSKEPWQMTKSEYIKQYKHPLADIEIKIKKGWYKQIGKGISGEENKELNILLSKKDVGMPLDENESARMLQLQKKDTQYALLSDVIDSPNLFVKYPFLQKIKIGKSVIPSKMAVMDYGISVGPDVSNNLSLFKHEITHIIQKKTNSPLRIGLSENLAGKKSWEDFTYEELQHYENTPSELEGNNESSDKIHKELIKRMVSEGKIIPPEVLKDYPDLQRTHTMPSGEAMPGAKHKETLTSEKAQKAIDNFTDILVGKYGEEEALNAPIHPEEYKKYNLPVPKTKIPESELKQLEDLYNIRDSIDEKDFESWKSTILKESKLPEEEMLAVLELLGFKKGSFGIYRTADNLRNWTREITNNLETIYNHFAHNDIPYQGSHARFRWGGTGEKPILEGSVFDEDLRSTQWDMEALRKTQETYNAISKTQGIEPINLLNIAKGGKRNAEILREGEVQGSIAQGEEPQQMPIEEGGRGKIVRGREIQAYEEKKIKTETPTTPVSPIEAKIKKETKEWESLTSRQQLAEQMKQAGMSDEEIKANIELLIEAPAKALGIPEDEFITQVKRSTLAELEGQDVTYQDSGLPTETVTKIETSLINNTLDDTISTNALRRYGKPHFVTISPSTPKQEAFIRLRRFLIDNPKGYDIAGDREILTDKEYLEGKRNKVQYQDKRGAIQFLKDGKAIIYLLENADKSTFAHEMFHKYVDMMQRLPQLRPQLKILETWIGKPVSKWSTADHEKAAKSGEKYLWEGNAPTSGLKVVFEKFKNWLREIYKTAKSLDIKLSDDVRKMWDEWFGGKEVKQATKGISLSKEILQEAKTENIFKQIKAITTNVKIDQSFFDHFDRSELIPIQRQSPGLFAKEKGMPLDEIADGLGISTDELADKIRNAISQKQDVELLTKQFKEYRPPVEMITVGDLGLKVGDKFKIHGEQYAVKEKDTEGHFLIEDGDKFIVDEFDKIPIPDEGSLKKGKYIQPKLLEGEKTDIKPKMETEVQGQKKMFADVGGYSELAQGKTKEGEQKPPPPGEPILNIPKGLGKLELPELVAFAKELLGTFPTLRRNLGKALGAFYPGKGLIKLRFDLAKDTKLAELVIAHEIGHSIDWLPDKTMTRGNLLGRIASLKNYLKSLLKEYPKSPNEILTDADRARFRKQALALAKEAIAGKTIGGEKISASKILAIWNDIQGKEKNPDLYEFIIRLDEKEKKQILLDAIKGKGLILPEDVQEFKNIDDKTKEIYRKLIREEIVKRKLYEEEVIRAELKKLTQTWKPFNEKLNSEFTKYRYSGKELYADAISVLLNNPELLLETAPNFYKAFFNYLENKPEVKEIYDAIQNKLGMVPGLRRDVVIQDRIKRMEEGYKRGHEARKGMEERQKGTTETIFDTIMTNLIDEEHADLKRIRKLEKQGGTEREIGRKARLSIEELVMIDSKIENLINHFTKEIDIPMRESNITLENLGVYAQASRVKGERGKLDIFNPGGETIESSQEMLEHLQKDWGIEKFNKVKELFGKYWELRQKFVFPALEEGQRYSPELIEYAKNNMFYTRFSVNKYLLERFGGQITGTIYKQYGTLSEIENPIVATMLQDIMLIRASKINESKLDMVEVLRETKELTPAEIDKSTEHWKPKPPTDPKNYGIFTVMRDGKIEHYYIDRQIAESYQYDPYKAKKIAEVVRIVSQPFRMLLVTRNPVWMGRNIFRDIKGTIKNVPEMKLRNIPEFMIDYSRGLKESIQDVFGGKRSEDITKLMEGSGLISGRYYAAKEGDYESKIQELQAEFVISNEEARQAPGAWNKLKRVVRLINEQLDKAGRVSEMSTKVAGYKYLKKHSIKSEREIMHDVRTLIGTPNARRAGRLQWLTNNIFMFSNIGKEGLRSSWESIRTNPTAYIWKTTALNIIPLLTLLGAGAAGVEWIKKILAELSQYDIEGKTIIPTPYTINGKPVAIGIPEDYQGQIARKLVFRILKMDLKGVLSVAEELNPYQFHPLIKIGQDLYQYYVRSENPRDEFRNMDIIPQRQFKVGGWLASESLLKHSWNELGGKTFLNFSYDEIKEDHKTIEGLKNIFPMNVLGTYLIVSNQGIKQSSYKIQEKINKEYEKRNYAIRQEIIKNINSDQQLRSNRIILSDLYIPMVQNGMINYRDTSPREFLAKYKRLESKKVRNPYLDSLENANRNKVKEALLNDYLKKIPKSEFRELIFDAVNSNIITREFTRGYLVKYNREIQEVMK